VSVVNMDEFVEWFFVELTDQGLFKTHDLLTEAVREAAPMEPIRRHALQSATEHLALRLEASNLENPERSLHLYHALLEGWQSVRVVPTEAAELLVDIGYELYDAGYWTSLADPPAPNQSAPDHSATLVARYFAALATRRTEG